MEDYNEILEEEAGSFDEKDNNDLYSTDAITFSKICHITTEPIDKNSVTMESVDNMLIARGHIIICGITHNFIDFIKPLRAKHLPKSECPTIVILCKELPDEKIWSTIAFFDQIYLIQGDAMVKGDLKRAGIKYAKKVVILAPSIQEISNFTSNKRKKTIESNENNSKTARKLTREEEDLLDSKTIFKYNMISKLKKDIFIIVELINPKNVSFLYNKGREQNDEYKFIKANINIDGTASFAAGEVYFSSIMDNLITQAYYNPSLLLVLKKLILGEDQTIYKKPPLSRYREIVSGNLYLIDLPQMDEKRAEYDYMSTLRLNQDTDILLPRKMTFREVFHILIKKKILVIGVYRAIDTAVYGQKNNTFNIFNFANYAKMQTINSNFYYVVTSPEPHFELNPKDKLFVISQTFPDEDIFNDNKKEHNHNKVNEDIIKQYENLQFIKNSKKNEEKKDIPKVFDSVGEMKIKEVNSNLKETIDLLRTLRTTINTTKDKVEKTLVDSVKSKFASLNQGLENIN